MIDKIKQSVANVFIKIFSLIGMYILRPIANVFAKYVYPHLYRFIITPIKKAFNKVIGNRIGRWYNAQTNKRKRAINGYIFTLPYIIGTAVFVLIPLFFVIFMSFNKVTIDASRGTLEFEWLNLAMYKRVLLEDLDYMVALQEYIFELIIFVPLVISLAIIIAVLLNSKVKAVSFFRLVFFMPVLVLSASFLEQLEAFGGLEIEVNMFVENVIFFFVSSKESYDLIIQLFSTVARTLWFTAVPALIFLGALQKVDKNLYEAAAIDGASTWDTFWKITLPSIWPLVSVAIIFIIAFMGSFDGNIINDIIMETSASSGKGGYGAASAIAVSYTIVQIAIIALLTYITMPKKRKGGYKII